jgi:membrane associated rhomboid family serine protease
MKRVFDPQSGFVLGDGTLFLLLFFLVLGFFGSLDSMLGQGSRIANWAHAGGLIAGIAIGYFPIWRQQRL